MKLILEVTDTISMSHRLTSFPDGHKCHNNHGHNAKILLRVSCDSTLLRKDGTIIDHALLKEVWRKYDHAGELNSLEPFYSQNIVPTVENIVLILHDQLEKVLENYNPQATIELFKWWETDDAAVEIRAE